MAYFFRKKYVREKQALCHTHELVVVVQADIYRRQRRKVKICVALVTISMQLQHTRQWQKQRRKKRKNMATQPCHRHEM